MAQDPVSGGATAPFEPVLTTGMGQARPWEVDDYVRRRGYEAARQVLNGMSPQDVIKVVTDSKLRGRGGAGFPAGIKWNGTRANPAPRYLVVNADESEPGTFSNRIAMDTDPHMLLEGMIICAYAVDIHAAYIYIRGENVHGFEVLERAIQEARAHVAGRQATSAPVPAAAPVPGGWGAVRTADGGQQRRDADVRPTHHSQRRRVVRRDRLA
jgi:NADH:ubiquinone oxidoreductase subunit F (NADH-binding)